MEPQEIVIKDPQPIDNEELVNGGKKTSKVDNKAKKKADGVVIKYLKFDNVAVIYKDEIGAIARQRISLTIPEVNKEWWQTGVRKALSLYFDESNILPTQVIQVSLPSTGGVEIEQNAPFLEKRLGDFTKKDCVDAAIYFKLRTVISALNADAEQMQESVWLHYNNRERLDTEQFVNGERQWDFPPFNPDAKL